MAIEDIFKALEEQADAECADILQGAREQAEAIIGEAQAQADRSKRERVEMARIAAQQRASQMLNAARLANRKDLADVRDRAIERAFEEAERKLAEFRKDSSYPQVLASLAEEARHVVESYGACTLLASSADAGIVGDIGGSGFQSVHTDLDTCGGCAVTAAEGRITVRNTFEARLAKVRRNAQSQVAEMLFE